MNRFKARWTAWPVALLLVLSVSGVAGASALISFNGPAASALEHSAVAQALKAALGVEDEDGDTDEAPDADEGTDAGEADDAEEAPDGDEDGTEEDADGEATDEAAAPTDEELAECAGDGDVEDLQRQDGESHGDYVSRIAQSDAVGGPKDNHGFCVSAAAHGLFDELSEEGTEEEPAEEEAAPMDEELAECAGDGDPEELKQQEGESHGDYVSRIAQSDAVGGPKDNHGFCVSAAARGLFDEDSEAEACESAKTEEPATDVEDEDVDDAKATCSEDAKAKAKADKAKAKAEAKAEKAKNKADRKAEKSKAHKVHGMGHGKGKGHGRGH